MEEGDLGILGLLLAVAGAMAYTLIIWKVVQLL